MACTQRRHASGGADGSCRTGGCRHETPCENKDDQRTFYYLGEGEGKSRNRPCSYWCCCKQFAHPEFTSSSVIPTGAKRSGGTCFCRCSRKTERHHAAVRRKRLRIVPAVNAAGPSTALRFGRDDKVGVCRPPPQRGAFAQDDFPDEIHPKNSRNAFPR